MFQQQEIAKGNFALTWLYLSLALCIRASGSGVWLPVVHHLYATGYDSYVCWWYLPFPTLLMIFLQASYVTGDFFSQASYVTEDSPTSFLRFSVLTAKYKYSDNKRDMPDSWRSMLMEESFRTRVLDWESFWVHERSKTNPEMSFFGGVRNCARFSMF